MTDPTDAARTVLVRRVLLLEFAILGWNVAGVLVLAAAAVAARSVTLAGFGLGSLLGCCADPRWSGPPTANPLRCGSRETRCWAYG